MAERRTRTDVYFILSFANFFLSVLKCVCWHLCVVSDRNLDIFDIYFNT